MTSSSRLVTAVTARNQLEAELWQAVLAEHGIPALLEPGGVHSFLGVGSVPVRLLVRPTQQADAQEVLAALAEAPEDGAQR